MKSNDSNFFLIWSIVALLFLLLILILAFKETNNKNVCRESCKGAIESEAKNKGTMLEQLIGIDKLNCICYYKDGIKTKRIR